jgi:signal transduction histidine kinase/CheY-like chemotaxis protein
LRASAARLDLALASARMGVWEYEPATDHGWWSPNLSEIFRLDLSGGGVAPFLEHVHADDRKAFVEQLAVASIGTHGSTSEAEFRVLGEDGSTRWARVFGRISESGSRRMLAGTMTDITEQRLLEERLHLASRLESIGRLAGGVAHDFNNLLAAMLGSVDMMDGLVHDDAREDLETIRHSALRARDLTRQLLAFARKQPVTWSTVDLSVLVRDVQLLFQRLAGPRVAIAIVIEAKPLVSADPTLLEQVLVNMVVNAREAMPDGGELEIRVDCGPAESSAPHGTARLTVTDSGVGMDEATRKRIFEPFFTTKTLGTGLGLASSYGIIQQHKGDIRVESAPVRGTRFIVTLPRVAPGDDAEPKLRSTSSFSPPAQGTVLVVDDEDAVRKTVTRLLRSLGYEVLDASSGAQALERSATHQGRIDLLICDIAMPGEDGRDVAARLLKARPGLKVMLMSGYSSDMQALRVEGASFLPKPFGRDELALKLGQIHSKG